MYPETETLRAIGEEEEVEDNGMKIERTKSTSEGGWVDGEVKEGRGRVSVMRVGPERTEGECW